MGRFRMGLIQQSHSSLSLYRWSFEPQTVLPRLTHHKLFNIVRSGLLRKDETKELALRRRCAVAGRQVRQTAGTSVTQSNVVDNVTANMTSGVR